MFTLRYVLGFVCASVLAFGAFGAASPASALTVDEIQAKIQVLLQQIGELSKQIAELRAKQQPQVACTADAMVCPDGTSVGRTGPNCEFKCPGGPSVIPPPITSNPIPPQHRICEALKRNLVFGVQGDDVHDLQEFLRDEGYLSASATGYFGALTSQAVTKWQSAQGLSAVGSFGPMSRERIKMWCGGGARACTLEYNPVCGAKPIVCIPTPCNPVPTTYGNRCMMKADGASFSYEGQCKNDTPPSVPNPENDPNCKVWSDGCNTCSRSTQGGPGMCTLMACMKTDGYQPAPYCKERFGTAGENKSPSISAFSGPTTLAINEKGTWKVSASDPENGPLTYDITWGDENAYPYSVGGMAPSSAAFVQQTTFEHTYAQAGIYTVVIVARDNVGATAKTTATVRVGTDGIACTQEYAPICGRPSECGNTCKPGMYCTMLCQMQEPKTYSNRCHLNVAGAAFLYEGACTSATQPNIGGVGSSAGQQ